MFFDRSSELALLERFYASSKAELFVLYGRRRVGKTELLRAFCQGKPGFFFIATLSSDSDQLAAFSQQVWRAGHAQPAEGFTFPSWEAAFRALADLPGRPVVVLDEFTYLISGNKAIPSILQKVWDETLKNTNLLVILCGSYIGMMESEVLGYQAPLYGRRTGSLLLQPLDLASTEHFFPAYGPEQRFQVWGLLGGMPYYLQVFSDRLSVEENILQHILEVPGMLHNEPRLLLMEELREPRNYFSILRAIAQGHTRLNEIAQSSGVGPVTATARYLDILQQMRLVTRRVPVTESQPEKSKKGIYQVNDHFLRFWFRYAHPNLGALDLGLSRSVLEQRILPDLDHFLASAFEEAACGYIARLARAGRLGFLPGGALPVRIGPWWDRETEIDLAAVSEENRLLLVGECKWSASPVGVNILEDLKRKAALAAAGQLEVPLHYFLFSKVGFTAELKRIAGEENVTLVSALEDEFWSV